MNEYLQIHLQRLAVGQTGPLGHGLLHAWLRLAGWSSGAHQNCSLHDQSSTSGHGGRLWSLADTKFQGARDTVKSFYERGR